MWWLGRMDRAPCSCHRLRERRVLRRGVAVAGHNVLLCRVSQVRTQLCNLPNDRSVAKNERPYRRGYLDPAHRPLRLPTRRFSLCFDRAAALSPGCRLPGRATLSAKGCTRPVPRFAPTAAALGRFSSLALAVRPLLLDPSSTLAGASSAWLQASANGRSSITPKRAMVLG